MRKCSQISKIRYMWGEHQCISCFIGIHFHRALTLVQFIVVLFQSVMYAITSNPLTWLNRSMRKTDSGRWLGTSSKSWDFLLRKRCSSMLSLVLIITIYWLILKVCTTAIACSLLLISASAGGWQIPVNAVCQCVLILMANAFLAVRSVFTWSLVDALTVIPFSVFTL
jgi:hypothetical protein